MTDYQTILVTQRNRVGLITLNRPDALNALSDALSREVLAAAQAFDTDPGIGAIVITGSERVFAAGADIKEMAEKSVAEMYKAEWFSAWDDLARVRTPVIAAVAGYAFGGGCELALICDFIIAAENAQFGQPEISIGVIPGMGGSQRLTRAIGKAKAMEMVLTGRTMSAIEAERAGLVAQVVPTADLLEVALSTADVIARMSKPVAMMAKEAMNAAFTMPLSAGVHFERRLFFSCFATEDQKEGMRAFTEKRQPNFVHR
ncbi:enoyl-CoA hydratase [Leifsonia kafniensis]|uniref:Enoyl-CoA hydratase n=1 Tax=Leifsonia kafniensis TaxID=475957 RepID=A0ABP7K3D7_9MICO